MFLPPLNALSQLQYGRSRVQRLGVVVFRGVVFVGFAAVVMWRW